MGWENEPQKKWYFNFGGQFLSQKKFYSKKLNGIGESHPVPSNSAIWKHFLKFHLASAALWLPSSSLATCPSNLAKSLFQLYFRQSRKPYFSSPISSIFPAGIHAFAVILIEYWRNFGIVLPYKPIITILPLIMHEILSPSVWVPRKHYSSVITPLYYLNFFVEKETSKVKIPLF